MRNNGRTESLEKRIGFIFSFVECRRRPPAMFFFILDAVRAILGRAWRTLDPQRRSHQQEIHLVGGYVEDA